MDDDIQIENPETMALLRDAIALALRAEPTESVERDQFLGFMFALCWVMCCEPPEDLARELVIEVN